MAAAGRYHWMRCWLFQAGPIADWGLAMERIKQVQVDTEKFATSLRVFCSW
jgi:hypothetical protein